MKTFIEKKIRRKIARGSKTGRYVVGRKGSRARPARKKANHCNNCGNTLPADLIGYLCKNCTDVVVTGSSTKENKMNIPGMTK